MRSFEIHLNNNDPLIAALEAGGATELFPKQAPPVAPAYHVPGPYEIALAMGAALAASGKYDTPGAAMQAAWAAVPEFFSGRDFYLREMVPAIYGLNTGEADGPASLDS